MTSFLQFSRIFSRRGCTLEWKRMFYGRICFIDADLDSSPWKIGWDSKLGKDGMEEELANNVCYES